MREIGALGRLPKGWNYGAGEPASATAQAHARLVAMMLLAVDAEHVSAFPGREGAILVCGDRRSESVEIQCFADGRFDFSCEVDGEAEPILTDLSFGDVENKLRSMGWQSRRLFASYIRDTLIPESAATSGQRFRIRRAAAFPLSSAIVFGSEGRASVSTLNYFIPNESRMIRLFSGG